MDFDYVVVGGGSAGCVIASRLSEVHGKTVCMLEAGLDGKGFMIRNPYMCLPHIGAKNPKTAWVENLMPQAAFGDPKGDYYPRGKGLGGSSALNAMMAVRGQPQDYDGWAKSGCTGWSWSEVLPFFKKAECFQGGADQLRGGNGPLQISRLDAKDAEVVTNSFITAAQDCGIKFNKDLNGASQGGVCYSQSTCFFDGEKRGQRCSTASAYIHPILSERPNLSVVTGAMAMKVILDGDRAVGVQYEKDGKQQVVSANIEVILCCGVINTAKLLLVSGIGPASELEAVGVSCKHDLRGVGKNFHDHCFTTVNYHISNKYVGAGPSMAFVCRGLTRTGRRGFFRSCPVQANAYCSTDDSSTTPDIQLLFVPLAARPDGTEPPAHGYMIQVVQLRPQSRGEVTITSADPKVPPNIDPQYRSVEADVEKSKQGVRLAHKILSGKEFMLYSPELASGLDLETDAGVSQMLREYSGSIYHGVGTCKMGAADDDNAVVDPNLKVRGLRGLRIADASIIPSITSGNTNLPCIMIGEKAASIILSQD
eukprot:CAMPEP_0174758216 /NCGR_PEP_ID=MMETSP1094-20130205/107641_1 /TAXON_ID=156173 /ORGANISM="Chrysochromulina brevifilum, Strain UTEX LB 985" /LENGTH=536 /DNA_ID=CAMNT_0015964143 /DNA_START=57 /DNA_END=1667 /DNA_ORIENTATION=+